jgi:hypothetical protein
MNWRHNAGGDITAVPNVGAPPPPPGEPEPPASNSWRNLVLGLILALIAVGLASVLIQRASSDDGGAPIASPTSLAPPASTPPTTSAQPPPLLNTGDDPDWAAMVRSMLAYDGWLRRNPRPELLQQWMLPTSPLYADARQTLEKLAAGEWRYDRPYEPLTADIVNLTSRHGSSVIVFLRYAPIPARRVLDRAGNAVLDQPAQPPNSAVWTLLRDSDGRWRFDKAERL